MTRTFNPHFKVFANVSVYFNILLHFVLLVADKPHKKHITIKTLHSHLPEFRAHATRCHLLHNRGILSKNRRRRAHLNQRLGACLCHDYFCSLRTRFTRPTKAQLPIICIPFPGVQLPTTTTLSGSWVK